MTVATTPPAVSCRDLCQASAITAMIWSPSTICALLVDDHDAVRVAVERDADVGPHLAHLGA